MYRTQTPAPLPASFTHHPHLSHHRPRCICKQVHRPSLQHTAFDHGQAPYGERRANLQQVPSSHPGRVHGVAPCFRKRLPTCVRRVGSNAFTSPNWPAGSVRAEKGDLTYSGQDGRLAGPATERLARHPRQRTAMFIDSWWTQSLKRLANA